MFFSVPDEGYPKTCRVHYIWYLCTYYFCATQPNLLSTIIGNWKISILWRIYYNCKNNKIFACFFNTTETPFSYRTKIHMYTSIFFISRIYLWGLVASFGDMQKQNGAVRVIKENVFFINISLLLNYRTSISLLRTPCFT